jgi:hypothetical protein
MRGGSDSYIKTPPLRFVWGPSPIQSYSSESFAKIICQTFPQATKFYTCFCLHCFETHTHWFVEFGQPLT